MLLNSDKLKVTHYELMEVLEVENIEARPVWKPLHLQPLFDGCAFNPHMENDLVIKRLFESGICLPSGSGMSEEEPDRVIQVKLKKLIS